MFGKWLCELCDDCYQVLEEASTCTEWLEDADRELSPYFSLLRRSWKRDLTNRRYG